jgi:hypothetical protein
VVVVSHGAAPRSGLFAFDKFSSSPFIMDAIRNDVGSNSGNGDLSRRIFLVPRTQVHRLNLTGNPVTSDESGKHVAISRSPNVNSLIPHFPAIK